MSIDKPEVGFRSGLCRYKAPQFSFTRLQADQFWGWIWLQRAKWEPLGAFDDALLASMLSVGYRIPERTLWFRQEGQSRK